MSKTKLYAVIENNKDLIEKWANDLLHCPEMGYNEFKTSAYVKKVFTDLGFECEENLGITGLKATLTGKETGPTIAVLGELDAVINNEHPFSNKETGASHACGHYLQLVQMLSVAKAFKESDVMQNLKGNIVFIACPAEEFVELNKRQTLINEKKITCIGGKQELIVQGVFDTVDIALMLHAHPETPKKTIITRGSSLGFISKIIRFTGKETHGSTPHLGINALSAANLALAGINANRETFADVERVKIHPIITKGGEMVNSIPKVAEIETYVRAATSESIENACKKVDNCAKGASTMIGTKLDITTIKGYLPLLQDDYISSVFEENAVELLGTNILGKKEDMVGSSDIGDVSHILPVIQPTIGGFVGSAHSKDFIAIDNNFHLQELPKIIVGTIFDLLQDSKTIEFLHSYKPKMTKEEYKKYITNKEV